MNQPTDQPTRAAAEAARASNGDMSDVDVQAGHGEGQGEIEQEQDELLTVIIPCLNEEKTVGPTAQSVLEHAPDLPTDVEILLIDDGSTDRTREEMERLCEEHSECRMLVNEQNMGLGRSAMRAYEHIDPDSWATIMPGDNEFMFESIYNFMEVRDRYDLIVGYLHNSVIRPFVRRLASTAFTQLINLLYGYQFRHLNGMKMYRVRVFQGLDVLSSGHAFNAELIGKALLRDPTIRIGQVPFMARGRSHGETNAFKPSAMLEAVKEVYEGKRSVKEYREKVIEEGELEGGER